MDDSLYGTRSARGEWTPNRRVEYAPLIVWPPRPKALLRWLFGYPGHIHFEVNHADGALPLDRWFGSFHDGSPEADEAMKKRRIARRTAEPADMPA
jgi:hypothetical protein